VLNPEDGLGRGFIMTREAGEALPQKLLRDPRYETARQLMPYQCGQAMAKIHQIPLASVLGSIPRRTYTQQLDDFQQKLDTFGNTSPVHQLALNWLKDHPPPTQTMALVHGDFRNGNLLVDEQGLVAVLDWELAHVGHPWEDLGYFCANVWRFGQYDKPAGGFGSVEALLEGYASVAGDAPTPLQLKAWELMAALSWGLVTQTMYAMWQEGVDRRLERAAVGRRMSESEIDILLLLDDLEALS
jgi:aminoglycoside phosphotransferase (APT) family kinase protein